MMKGNAHERPLLLPVPGRIAGGDLGLRMIEVFRTNVEQRVQASFLLDHLRRRFPDYAASFDLEDYDRVLRVESLTVDLDASAVIDLLGAFGFRAEILDDEDDDPITSGLHSAIFITE
ncbi:hypothetical protein [Dyadobacter sandarakinus]|uniref:Uncharacterized protein n=1 Tax=Dyadobacter sandarakinus TaxID=2747268 RepID=A0ABX7I315_9BACT|nr:hypothetical protein [Dyadobacter sandarakinus]QRR00481.1 hypothetical protein HWI92_05940 [Dyadobacter sandarakinus]